MRRALMGSCQIAAWAMAPVLLVSIWLHAYVLNNDRYSDSMQALGSDASFQQAFSSQVTRLLNDEIDKLTGASDLTLIQGYLDAAGGIEALHAEIDRGVERLVLSPGFVRSWIEVNRLTHQQLVAFIRGESSLLSADGRVGVSLDLATIASWLDPFTDDTASVVLTLAMADGATRVQIAQSRSFPPAEWVARNSAAVALSASTLFVVTQALALVFSGNRGRMVVVACAGIALMAVLTLIATKTLVSSHLMRIRDVQGRALAREYVDAVLSSFLTLAAALAAAGLIASVAMLALPYLRGARPASGIGATVPGD
jgi:hypothetical protein